MTFARAMEERPRVAVLGGMALVILVAVAVWLGGTLASGSGTAISPSQIRAAEARAAAADKARVAAEARTARFAAQERAARREIGRLEQRLRQWRTYHRDRRRADQRPGRQRAARHVLQRVTAPWPRV